MGTITVTTFGADPQTVNVANLNALVTPIITECNGKLDNTNIVAAAGIVDTKLATISTAGKVLGAALNTLAGIPSGAGVIPVANLGSGSPSALNCLLGSGAFGTLSIQNVKVGSATHDISTVGDQAIASVGFTPKLVIVFAAVDATAQMSFGLTDGTVNGGISDDNASSAGTYIPITQLINMRVNGSTTFASASWKSFDADGFTITWSKTGSPTGTCTFKYLCL